VRATLRADGPGNVRFIGSPLAMARLGLRATRRLALLASDAAEPALRPPGAWGRPAHTFRIWWNRSDEVEAYLRSPAGSSSRTAETQVCFFPEISADVARLGLDLISTPYAFSWPRRFERSFADRARPVGTDETRIFYAGELDVSDSCFADLLASTEAKVMSDRVWDLAYEVVGGHLTLVAADGRLGGMDSGDAVHHAGLWALRNRTRYLLLRSLRDEFGDRLVLRGSDLGRLGLTASPTRFNRHGLLADYVRHRVALDLGSKSTHATLYPRSADALSVAAGLVQFDSGLTDERWRAPIASGRSTNSSDGLIGAADRMLSRPAREVADENVAMHEVYRTRRLQAGSDLLAGMVEALRQTSPIKAALD
jgi:hypothetical protein